jgi:VCBS repeat-containing protein
MTRNVSVTLLVFAALSFAADDVATAVEGVVQKTDAATKTAVVKTADGTEHTFHFVKKTAVHGADDTAAGAKDAFHGLKEGSEVVVHYTTKGTEKTASEVDKVGKEGLKSTEGIVTRVDKKAKTVAIKAADGTEETFRMTADAAKEGGHDVVKGTEKAAKVTVYYTEEAGHKVAHFFKSSTT